MEDHFLQICQDRRLLLLADHGYLCIQPLPVPVDGIALRVAVLQLRPMCTSSVEKKWSFLDFGKERF